MEKKKMPSIGIAILTLNAKNHLYNCISPFLTSSLKPRVLVVDSSSTDGTPEAARVLGAEVLTIEREDFNHGLTREKARRHLGTDIVVMVTPDAYAKDATILEKLIKPIQNAEAAVAYARQIPHKGAKFFEAFPRDFNYPAESQMRGIEDFSKFGVYTFFCSDSCAAYSNQALNEIGGFEEVLLGEDTVAAARLLRKGYKIAYVAEAEVYHSHCYTLKQEFQRYFDTGLARKAYKDVIHCGGGDGRRGSEFVKKMLKTLIKENPVLLPYAITHILAKWAGYCLGSMSGVAPLWFKKRMSSQKFYWKSKSLLNKKD